MWCKDGGDGWWVESPSPNSWGDWGNERYCPDDTVVCGLQTRVEDKQHDGDDTALNGLAIYCCKNIWKKGANNTSEF